MGGPRTLNGPQGGLAFDLECADCLPVRAAASSSATHNSQRPTNATELLEHYWASLLRDVAFTDYDSSALAAQAAAELGSQPTYFGPRNASGQVTTDLLFRGDLPG